MSDIVYKDGVYYIGHQSLDFSEFYYDTKEKCLYSNGGLDHSVFDDYLVKMMIEKVGEEEFNKLNDNDPDDLIFDRNDTTIEEVYRYIFDILDNLCGLYNDCKKIYFESDFVHRLYPVMNKFVNVEEISLEGSRWFNLECSQFPISVKKINIDCMNLNKNIFYRGKDGLINLTELNIIE